MLGPENFHFLGSLSERDLMGAIATRVKSLAKKSGYFDAFGAESVFGHSEIGVIRARYGEGSENVLDIIELNTFAVILQNGDGDESDVAFAHKEYLILEDLISSDPEEEVTFEFVYYSIRRSRAGQPPPIEVAEQIAKLEHDQIALDAFLETPKAEAIRQKALEAYITPPQSISETDKLKESLKKSSCLEKTELCEFISLLDRIAAEAKLLSPKDLQDLFAFGDGETI